MPGRVLAPAPAPGAPARIRVAPRGRYLETADSAPFLFVGANDALPWPGVAGLHRRRDPAAVDAYLTAFAGGGVTVLLAVRARADATPPESAPGALRL